MSRKRGERNWGDELPFTLHQEPVKTEQQVPGRLAITELDPSLPSYEVRDQHDNLWVVMVAADGTPEIIDRPEGVYHNQHARVVKAVKRYRQNKT